MATLYIVSTPLGNLEDITLRALETLKRVDLILCEDTRVTKKLLERCNIKTPLLSYHQHSKPDKVDYILDLFRKGKNLALVSDAGTPGISDPGSQLVKELTVDGSLQVEIVPVPGPSALTAAASVSGVAMDRFLFLGFPRAKKKRKKFFEEVANSKYPVIFYESPHRIVKTLSELKLTAESYKLKPDVVVCRELTKKFETIYRGNIDEVLRRLKKDEVKGEFTIVVGKN